MDTVRDLTTFAKSRVDGLRVSKLCIQEEEELGNEGIAMLCRGIGDFFVRKWELRELCLELCGMGESSAKCLANVLHRCVHLRVLSISHNPDIGDQAAANIVTSLVRRKVSSAGQNMMNALKLCCVSASRKTAKAVAEMLTKSEFSSIRDLDLRNNRIDCIGASAIASSLSSVKSSSRLRVRLDTNLIEDRGAASLLSALKFRPKILQITLSQNETSPMLRSSFAIASNRSSAFYGTAPPSFVLPGI